MNERMLFIDGSVNTQKKIGYGAFLVLAKKRLPMESLKANIRLKRFENTSSTKLELQTLLWALSKLEDFEGKLKIYTDSQNLVNLPGRRRRLEHHDYYSRKNKRLKHYQLYQQFYQMSDTLDCEFIKVQGHRPSREKDDIDRLFTLVDRASRRALQGD